MSLSTDNILKPQDKVFTKKRSYGPVSVGVAVLSAMILLPLYASLAGNLVPIGWVMVLLGFVGAVIAPWVLSRRLRSRGPRLFCLLNILVALVLLIALGNQTDRALEENGLLPFESLAGLLGASDGDDHAVTVSGEVLLGALRALTITKQPEDEPGIGVDKTQDACAEDVAPTEGEPRAIAPVDSSIEGRTSGEKPSGSSAEVVPKGSGDGKEQEARKVQAYVRKVEGGHLVAEASESLSGGSSPVVVSGDRVSPGGSATYSVLGRLAGGPVEVPIERDGRTFDVGVLVNGNVPADFVFDTGADLTAITPALARRLGFDVDSLDDKRLFHTAGGPVEDPVVRVDRLAIDTAEVRGVEVVVCSRCSSNLLGRNFHGQFRVEIDSARGVLRLHPR